MVGANCCGVGPFPGPAARHGSFLRLNCSARAIASLHRDHRLAGCEVYVSPVELNQENGAIEDALMFRCLRVADPVQCAGWAAVGIIVINVDMRAAFARIRAGATRAA